MVLSVLVVVIQVVSKSTHARHCIVEPEPAQARDLANERAQRGLRSLVALRPSEDLLFCAKHLFFAARGALRTGEAPNGG